MKCIAYQIWWRTYAWRNFIRKDCCWYINSFSKGANSSFSFSQQFGCISLIVTFFNLAFIWGINYIFTSKICNKNYTSMFENTFIILCITVFENRSKKSHFPVYLIFVAKIQRGHFEWFPNTVYYAKCNSLMKWYCSSGQF